MSSNDDELRKIVLESLQKRKKYKDSVFDSVEFQNALKYLEDISGDFIEAQTMIRLMGSRFSADEQYALFRFAPYISESVLAVQMCAKQGMQNVARRELRFLLEAFVKLSSIDSSRASISFEERIASLGDRSRRFEDYVANLPYFEQFAKTEDIKAEILSLYSALSVYVHATDAQFKENLRREKRGDSLGMEGIKTLNAFNRLAFQVFDIALVHSFYGLGLGLAGDVFTSALDDMPKWKFHKGRFIKELSACFDYKAERQPQK